MNLTWIQSINKEYDLKYIPNPIKGTTVYCNNNNKIYIYDNNKWLLLGIDCASTDYVYLRKERKKKLIKILK